MSSFFCRRNCSYSKLPSTFQSSLFLLLSLLRASPSLHPSRTQKIRFPSADVNLGRTKGSLFHSPVCACVCMCVCACVCEAGMGVGFFFFFARRWGYEGTLQAESTSLPFLTGGTPAVCGRTAGSWTVPNEIGHDGSRAKARFDAVLTLGHSW